MDSARRILNTIAKREHKLLHRGDWILSVESFLQQNCFDGNGSLTGAQPKARENSPNQIFANTNRQGIASCFQKGTHAQ